MARAIDDNHSLFVTYFFPDCISLHSTQYKKWHTHDIGFDISIS